MKCFQTSSCFSSWNRSHKGLQTFVIFLRSLVLPKENVTPQQYNTYNLFRLPEIPTFSTSYKRGKAVCQLFSGALFGVKHLYNKTAV